MKYSSAVIFLIIGIIAGVIPTFFFTKNTQPVDQNIGERFLSYENKELGFFLEYPEELSEITEGKEGVTFDTVHSPEEMSDGFYLRVTPTAFSSTERWIAAQAIGSENVAGIKALVQVGGSGSYFIINYTQVDSESNGDPLYGQILSGVMVKNKKLYELQYRNQFSINTVPSIDPKRVHTLASLGSPEFENTNQTDIDNAKNAVILFLSNLYEKHYEEASQYYGSDYDQLREWNPTIDQNDYKELWKNGCEINGLNCLEIRNLEARQKDGLYTVYVWFSNKDGSEFRSNTPDGSSPEESSQNVFPFTVTKSEDGSFKVQTMPPYTP